MREYITKAVRAHEFVTLPGSLALLQREIAGHCTDAAAMAESRLAVLRGEREEEA